MIYDFRYLLSRAQVYDLFLGALLRLGSGQVFKSEI